MILDIQGLYLEDHKEIISYDKERDLYTFEYVKYVNDVESFDRITIIIDTFGHIYSYRSSLWGKINKENIPKFDLEEIRKKLIERLDGLTQEAQKKYDQVEYKDFSYWLSSVDDSFIVLCSVNVDCINKEGTMIKKISERLCFVVPL